MDCRAAQERLLSEETPTRDRLPVGELADHVDRCGACRQFLSELAQLEQSWRAIPLPAGAEKGPEKFLEQFRHAPASQSVPLPRRRQIPTRWLVAASILIAVAIGGGFFITPPRAIASTDVVERLVDWNLSLAHAPSVGERGRIYADRVTLFTDELKRAEVPSQDRELVHSLLEKAPELVRVPDPLAEADRFNDLAEKLLARMSDATKGGDARRVDQSATLYRRVAELGIEPKLEVLEASRSLDFERQRRLERLVLRDADRMKALVELLERAPDSSRKQIKRALGIVRRPRKTPATRSEPARSRQRDGRNAQDSSSPFSEKITP